jgi:hypothetical protein
MKKNKQLEERRKSIPEEIRKKVEESAKRADREYYKSCGELLK